jgi:multicomponent Na+:H+ antiporter subunit D
MDTYLLAGAVGASLAAAPLILVSGSRPNLRESWTFLAAIVKIGVIVALLPAVLRGEEPEAVLFPIIDGVTLALRADAAGMIFALSASVLWLLTSVYSIGYVRGLDEKRQTRYFASFALCLSATIGLAFAANLLTFFIFYELLTAATYPLVAHKETPEAIRAGRRYLGYLLTGGVAVLLATASVHALAPGVDFTAGGYLAGEVGSVGVVALFALFVVGFGTKSAVMPLHAWLPSAMVAPTPVSALLHAVAVVKAGVFGFARAIGFVIGPEELWAVGASAVLAALAAVTIVVASLIAFREDKLKRRLAYSTIAHLSYIVLGLSLITATAWNGALLHIVNHAALKITLFFCAGAIYVRTSVDRISEMDGIGRQMPLTMAAFGVASLGLAGVPPIGGFFSKWQLGLGAIEAQEAVLAVVVIGSGLLTAGYLLPIFFRAFFRPSARFTRFGEASAFMVVPLVLTALAGLLLGFGDLFTIGELAGAASTSVTGVDR